MLCDAQTNRLYTLSLHDALPIYQEMASGEGGLAVRRGGGDKYDAVAGFESAVAVDHKHRIERPAPMCLGLDLGKPFLGHARSEEHTSELQSHSDLVCRLLLEKKK